MRGQRGVKGDLEGGKELQRNGKERSRCESG